MKTDYPIQLFDLRFPKDYVKPKKIMIFEEYNEAPTHAVFWAMVIKNRGIKVISDGNKICVI